MEKLVSSWAGVQAQTLPENYVFPPDKRPGNLLVPLCNNVPVVDLANADDQAHDRGVLIERILKASQEFGLFQVINHGVSEDLMGNAMELYRESFNLPPEDKAGLYSDDPRRKCRLHTSTNIYDNEQVHLWRDNLRRSCYPLGECVQFWPEKPARYREIVGAYSMEMRKLSLKILKLISEGLELEPGYFGEELSKEQLLVVNYYPPCPDPSLTLGMAKHGDPNIVAILQQGDIHWLQVFKDGQWIGVEPIPNAFVVNMGHQLRIISNGKLKCAEHRAVTNFNKARTTIVGTILPYFDSIIEPAIELINEGRPPLYRAFRY